MRVKPEHEYLFSQTGAKRWLNRPRLPTTNALLPLTYDDLRSRGRDTSRYAYAADPRMLKLTEALSTRLTDEFPVDVEASGFAGPSAVPGNFHAVRSVSGYGMDPLPLPLMDNSKFVESLGLVSDIRPHDLPWLQEIIRLFFGHVAPAPLHIRKKASTSFPYFTTDNQYKKLSTLKCLHHIDDFLAAMTGNQADLERGLKEYHSLHVFALHERHQPSSVSLEKGNWKAKDRVGPTEEEARTGNFTGSTLADMSVKNDSGQVIEGHFAMRRRTVFGFSGIPNYVMTAIMGCHREVYLNRFAFTYKTKGWQDKEDRIDKFKYVVGSDVKNMDTTVPEWFFEALYSELPKYWDERLIKMLRRMMHATFIAPSPWRDTPEAYDPVFGPDPLSGEANLHTGLPSGIFINPDIGKLWMTFVYVILFRDSGALSAVSEIEPFLSGRNTDHALLNMSDDATLMTNSPHVRDGLKAASSPYTVLEPETPVIFLGDVFTSEGGKKKAYPNPLTYIINNLAREDSIDKIDPILYAEGTLARFQQYSRTPIFRDMNAIYEEEVRRHLGVNPYLIARSVARRQKFEDLDALVIANPHYLHYRVDPKDVSPEILDEMVATIPAADFFNQVRHLFKVPSVQLEEFNE